MACVALPTCGLAMAEAERYLPVLIDKIEGIVEENGLRDKEITIRMTGCPNGCARHALGEIGFIGKAPGKYNMYLGAAHDGSRLSKMYRENIGEEEILKELSVILPRYAKERQEGEHFGDFVIRTEIIKKVTDGTNFHQ
jgi:sulfite reductase (NADPH) hemoprotein beta-component